MDPYEEYSDDGADFDEGDVYDGFPASQWNGQVDSNGGPILQGNLYLEGDLIFYVAPREELHVVEKTIRNNAATLITGGVLVAGGVWAYKEKKPPNPQKATRMIKEEDKPALKQAAAQLGPSVGKDEALVVKVPRK